MNCPKCECGEFTVTRLENIPVAEIRCKNCGIVLGIFNDLKEIYGKLTELENKMTNIERIFKETLRNKGLF
ncbi:MAG: hypothetical protein ACOWWO_08335 [Peptococcaceae bacterium]